jgi:hypothetical protein
MSLPGFVSTISLKRGGQTSQDAIGSPVIVETTVWTKKGHYQQMYGNDQPSPAGRTSKSMFKFWPPYHSGSDRPQVDDTLFANGNSYTVASINEESLKHHLLVEAWIVER